MKSDQSKLERRPTWCSSTPSAPEWSALHNPVNSLVYNADGRSVHTVIVDGKIVVQNHTPLFVDERELIPQIQNDGQNLLTRTNLHYPPRWPIL